MTCVDPDAGGVGEAGADDAPVGDGADDGLLQKAHVGVEVQVVVIQGDDGVGDELAGAVKGDVAAAVGFDDFDAAGGEEGGRGEEVARGAGVAADGDDGGMLDEEEETGVGGAFGDLGVEFKLAVPGGTVGEEAKVEDFEGLSWGGAQGLFL